MTAGTKAWIAMLHKQCVLEQILNSHNQDFRSLHRAKYEGQLREKIRQQSGLNRFGGWNTSHQRLLAITTQNIEPAQSKNKWHTR